MVKEVEVGNVLHVVQSAKYVRLTAVKVVKGGGSPW